MELPIKTQKIIAVVCGTALLIVILIVVLHQQSQPSTVIGEQEVVNVGEKTTHKDTSSNSKNTSDSNTDTSDYTYTAAPGDSYTSLARTAINDYTGKHNIILTDAQVEIAESNIVATAGYPELSIDQPVTFSQASIKSAVDAALASS